MKSIFPYPSSLGTPPSTDSDDKAYTNAEIDAKDAVVLSGAKDYTDTAAMGGATPDAGIGTF